MGRRATRAEDEPAARLAPALVRALRRELGSWYAREKRALPWRGSADPYRVWISEAMLQQTRVEVVRGYFERFLARFPDVGALAAADESEVLAAWSGLGYYGRARALRRAARAVVEHHGGRFPAEVEALRALPGVGPYTAGAIASIAFGRAEPLVDGNVARVLARLFALDEPPGAARERRLWSLAAELVPREAPGEWNQALMELGATVCAPRAPACGRCPLAARCEARLTGRVAELPRPRARAAPLDVALEIALVEREGKLLVLEREAAGRMAGLWEPPTRELDPSGAGGGTLLWPAAWPCAAGGLVLDAPLGALAHAITRHRVRARVLRARLAPGAELARPAAWIAPESPERALTGLARKALALWARGKREGGLFA